MERKLGHRLLSMVLSVLMLLSLTPTTAFATGESFESAAAVASTPTPVTSTATSEEPAAAIPAANGEEEPSAVKGTKDNPYTRAEFGAMTRAEYVEAQKALSGTMYVDVGEYSYDKSGTLGNGVRDDIVGQIPDHSKLNAYGENGYLDEGNDGANGKTVVFVDGAITSGAMGYASIDNIGTDLLLAVPAYTHVKFEGITFNNVISFNYQLYTSPWSQLGSLEFDKCTFNGIIVGAIASQTLNFTGCTFTNYTNTTFANNSNPTWIRPAYGNWTKGDNEGQGGNFRSLTTITFKDNTVTSTRPVKFERIAQWEMATTVTATGNKFTMSPQDGDKDTKNIGLYFGANAKFDLVVDDNTKFDNTAALYTAVYNAPNDKSYAGLPAGTTVKNANGADVEITDACAWKKTDKITLKTTSEVASVAGVKFATLADAIAAAKDGNTVTLLADTTEKITVSKDITLDLAGKTLSSTDYQTIVLNYGVNLTVTDSSAEGTGKITNAYTGTANDPTTVRLKRSNVVFTLKNGTIESNPNRTDLQSVAINSDKQSCTVNIAGGKVLVPEAATKGRAIVASKGMVLNISDGEIVGGLHGVDTYSGSTTTVTGGTISARYVDTGIVQEAFGMRLKGTPIVTIDGGTVSGVKMDDDGNTLNVPAVTLKNGEITGSFYSITKGTIEFTIDETAGILFDNDSVKAFLPSSLELRQDANGKYTVKKISYVAQIDDAKYETLEEAIKAAKDGDTVKLLANCSGNGIQVEEDTFATKGLTVDFAGHTYTVGGVLVGSAGTGTNAFQLRANNKITFQNGTIAGVSENTKPAEDTPNWYGAPAMVIQNYCNLTLKGMTISGGDETVYTMSNNCGDVVIEDTTINAGKAKEYGYGPFAFDVCGFSSYPGVSVTVKGTSVINGDIEVSRSGNNTNQVKLALENGTINGKLSIDKSITSGDATTITKSADVALPAPDGYTWNAEGVLVQVKYVAEVDGKKYENLSRAIDAASDGGTVTLLADISNTGVWICKNLTIDGNGRTLSNVNITTGTITAAENYGKKIDFTLKNLKFTGDSYIEANNCAALTVEGCTADVAPSKKYDDRIVFIHFGSKYAVSNDSTTGLKLTIKDSQFVVSNGVYSQNSPAVIYGYNYISRAEITGNTFGSESVPCTFFAVGLQNATVNAQYTISDNTVYGSNIDIDGHTTRNFYAFALTPTSNPANAYSATFENNTLINTNKVPSGHTFKIAWVSASSGKVEAKINAKINNTINGELLTAADIWVSDENSCLYAGVDIVTNNNGKIIGGTLAVNSPLTAIAEGYTAVKNTDGTHTVKKIVNVKLTVNVGQGKVKAEYDSESKTETWKNDQENIPFPQGTEFTLTAAPNNGYKFLYWVNQDNRIVCSDASYKFTLGDNKTVTAVYAEDDSQPAYVIVLDMNKKILSRGYATNGSFRAPEPLGFEGFEFIGWFDESGEACSLDTNGYFTNITESVTIIAHYKKIEAAYTVTTIINETKADEKKYSYGAVATVTAVEPMGEQHFTGWFSDGKLVSTALSYSFVVTADITLEAMYGETCIDSQPTVSIIIGDRKVSKDGKTKLVMDVSWDVPDEFTFVTGGFLRTFDESKRDDLKLGNEDGKTIKKSETTLCSASGTYSLTLTLGTTSSAKKMYAVGYIIYKNNATGELVTVYTARCESEPGSAQG